MNLKNGDGDYCAFTMFVCGIPLFGQRCFLSEARIINSNEEQRALFCVFVSVSKLVFGQP